MWRIWLLFDPRRTLDLGVGVGQPAGDPGHRQLDLEAVGTGPAAGQGDEIEVEVRGQFSCLCVAWHDGQMPRGCCHSAAGPRSQTGPGAPRCVRSWPTGQG